MEKKGQEHQKKQKNKNHLFTRESLFMLYILSKDFNFIFIEINLYMSYFSILKK